jgi:lipopolysaccharide export system permease protein
MKASCVSLYNMIRPVMLFAFGAFLVTALISLLLAPRANHALRIHLFKMVRSQALIGIEPGVFSSTFTGMVIYVDKMETVDNMEGIFISDERTAREPYAIVARHGRLISDPESLKVTLALQEGAIHSLPRNENTFSTISFDSGNLYLDISNALIPRDPGSPDFEEIDSFELYRNLARARAEGKPTRGIEGELQKRLSLPFACLLFGLIGAPLGIRRTRSGKSAGIALALVVFLVYYVLLAIGTKLSSTGKLPPAVAYWMPNIILTLGAGLLVYKKGQEKEFGIGHRIVEAYYRMKTRKKLS